MGLSLPLRLCVFCRCRATDETWSVADVTVTAELDPDYEIVYASDFEEFGATGWTFLGGEDAATTTCGDMTLLGGYDVLGESHTVVKKLSNLPDHSTFPFSAKHHLACPLPSLTRVCL